MEKLSHEQRVNLLYNCLTDDPFVNRLSKLLVLQAFRNAPIEKIHGGVTPQTDTGDYSDVKVVWPSGEIPWNEVSHIRQAEMKEMMIYAVNSVFTILRELAGPNSEGILASLMMINPLKDRWYDAVADPLLERFLRERVGKSLAYAQVFMNGPVDHLPVVARALKAKTRKKRAP